MKRFLATIYVLLIAVIVSYLFLPPPIFSATIYNTIQFRRGTAAAWSLANPVLASGEPGFETDTGYYKIGDGLAHWNNLPYAIDNALSGGIYDNGIFGTIVRAPQIGSSSYTDNGYFANIFWGGNQLDNAYRYSAPYVDVRSRGADNTGVASSSAAFNNAIAALASTGGVVLVPPGTYLIDTTVRITANGITIRGSGAGVTKMLFSPAGANTIAFDFRRNPDTVTLSYVGMSDLTIYNPAAVPSGSIGIRVYDISESNFKNVRVHQLHALDNTAEGLRTMGRELTTFDHCTFTADKPVHVMQQVNGGSSAVSLDFFTWTHTGFFGADLTQTVPSPHPLFTIDNEVIHQNTVIEYGNWTMGTHGVYQGPGVVNTGTSLNLRLRGNRWEQSTDTSGWFVYLNHYVQGFTAEENTGGSVGNGFYFRNVYNPVLTGNIVYSGGTMGGSSGTAIDIDNTSRSLLLLNNHWNSGVTFNHPNMSEIFAAGFIASTVPKIGYYESDLTTANSGNKFRIGASGNVYRNTYEVNALDNGSSYTIPYFSLIAPTTARITVTAADNTTNLEAGTVVYGKTKVSLLDNTANFVATNGTGGTAGKLSVDFSSEQVINVVNKLGYTIWMNVSVEGAQ